VVAAVAAFSTTRKWAVSCGTHRRNVQSVVEHRDAPITGAGCTGRQPGACRAPASL
jgi:hypothetical protein